MSGGLFPESFDPTYFVSASWAERVKAWIAAHESEGFSHGNAEVIRQILANDDTGLRMVVNITADALLSVLREGRYRNLYERPVVGGKRREASPERQEVDRLLAIGPQHYFGAVALGGAGVRYYGEYCMVLNLARMYPDSELLDRDSYDLVLEPLNSVKLRGEHIACLRGSWSSDRVDMALRKVLPEVGHDSRLVTSGTVSEVVLRDQEFIEVHLEGSFGPADLEEVRQSPDDAAMELTINERKQRGMFTTAVEREWTRRRAAVARQLDAHSVRHRIVTLHGRGYQWK